MVGIVVAAAAAAVAVVVMVVVVGLDLYQSREERHFLQTDFYISF